MEDAPDPLAGRTIQGRYRVLHRIGRGGMGSVYEVEHLAFGGRFALKTLHAQLARDAGAVRRFKLEARAAAATGHKHVVQVTDMGELEDGAPFIVLELLRGRSLAKEIRALGRLTPARSVSIALQCCAALAATHERGIVHRDLKPENIFLVADHAPADFVKVLDFGVSKFTEGLAELGISRRTTEGTQIGTPVFMSPEQLAGAPDVGPAADQFSLGVVLYEMLTGRLPFEAAGFAALVVAITTSPARPPSELAPAVPPELDAIVLRTMEKRPEHRFRSMADLAMALLPLHRPAHADTSGGWTAALGGLVPVLEGSGPEGSARAAAVTEPEVETTTPLRRPIRSQPGSLEGSGAEVEPHATDETGPLGRRDSPAAGVSLDRATDEGPTVLPAPRAQWTTAVVAGAAAFAFIVSAVLLVQRVAGGGGAGATTDGHDVSGDGEVAAGRGGPAGAEGLPADVAHSAPAPDEPAPSVSADPDSDSGPDPTRTQRAREAGGAAVETRRRAEPGRGRRGNERSRAASERVAPTPSQPTGASRTVTIRSEWDATVSLTLACGGQTVRASVPPFGSRTVSVPSAECLVHCTSVAGLPRCALRLPASASAFAIRR